MDTPATTLAALRDALIARGEPYAQSLARGKTHALIADGRLAVLAGDDLQIFSTLALGGSGAIAASAHVHTARFVEVIRLLRCGALKEARVAWMPLVPVIESMFAEPNPASIKAALAQQGWIENELRAPMMMASDSMRL